MTDRKLIFKCRAGSHLYGLSTPESDEDFISVFIPSTAELLGLHNVKQIDKSTKKSNEKRRNTKDDTDDKMYSLPEFCRLILKNNPNLLELLFANEENIIVCEPEFKTLMLNYDEIISEKVLHSFTGYAFAQRKKLLGKKERYTSLVEGIKLIEAEFGVDVLNNRKYTLTQKDSDWMNENLKFYKNRDGNVNSFHIGMPIFVNYEKLLIERDNYGWRVHTDTFLTHGMDLKFAYQTIRILTEGLELLKTGKISFPISGEYKEDIMRIRNGEVYLPELLEIFDKYNDACKEAGEHNGLRHKPNSKWLDNYLVNVLEQHIKK